MDKRVYTPPPSRYMWITNKGETQMTTTQQARAEARIAHAKSQGAFVGFFAKLGVSWANLEANPYTKPDLREAWESGFNNPELA